MSPEAAQGRNSPREAKPAGHAGAVPLLAEPATEQEAMPLLAVQPRTPRRLRGPNPGTMHAAILQMKAARPKAQNHGEVYGQQPLGLGEVRNQPFASWQIRSLCDTPEMPPSSLLLVRRQQSRMQGGQMPMSDMSVNTKEAWLQQREEDTAAGIEGTLYYEELGIETKEYPERFETVALRPSQRAAKRWTVTTPMRDAKFREWARNVGYSEALVSASGMREWHPEEVPLSGTTDGCP